VKNLSRAVLVLVIVAIAAVVLYIGFAGHRSKPQPRDEFPTEQTPPST
jgi:hypothetical protein